ncbi:amidase [Metabacillus niabensis]|uniref:amidase n=1 Tax=Metabacillus niabensis TaxID=324854 RepID=UPI001CFB3574|nr:amidase [Metabacillus niabensis]
MQNNLNAFVEEEVIFEPTGAGLLEGLVFAVKDVFSIEGYRSGAGNPGWLKSHGVSTCHAPVIERLLSHGAKLKGTTQTDELMYSLNGENAHYGTPVNPKAPNRIPGGSSSGSAVAVSAGISDFALGTDTGGSVRIPSSYCGIYGFRPSHGVVPVGGVIPLAKSFDTVGWMSKDSELLYRVGKVLITDQEEKGLFKQVFYCEEAWNLLDERCKGELLTAVSVIKEISRREWITLSESGLDEWSSAFRILQGLEIWEEHGDWIRKENPAFGPGIHERFQWTSTLKRWECSEQEKLRVQIRKSLSALLKEDGVIVIPTAPGPAPLLDLQGEKAERYRAKIMQLSCIAGLVGLPQVTVPLAEVDGLPIGLSFIANHHQDLKLLKWVNEVFGGGGV